jgi:hypothetical protein
MRLLGLFIKNTLYIYSFLIFFYLKVEHFMAVINILEDERIFKHLSSSQFQERVSSHIVG